jgi:predicted DNA-binding protein (UPF0251 family)
MSGRESAATLEAMRLVEEDGLTMSEAARRTGIAFSTIHRARVRAGLPLVRKKRELAQSDDAREASDRNLTSGVGPSQASCQE